MLNIKKAYIARFYDMSEDGNWMKLFIDDKTTEHCYCLIDNDSAININTGTIYHILKRDERHRITIDEAEKIVFNNPYVLDVEPVNWNEMNAFEKRYLYLKGLLAHNNYQKQTKKAEKVKKLKN
ncbi:MAG: hypothetical protein PHO63_01375 [Bacilli bacterium]|nr:hypothetical protein [Bacilli bacterium]MDD4808818.1 hypothetical protein [Bacilli bacterium]